MVGTLSPTRFVFASRSFAFPSHLPNFHVSPSISFIVRSIFCGVDWSSRWAVRARHRSSNLIAQAPLTIYSTKSLASLLIKVYSSPDWNRERRKFIFFLRPSRLRFWFQVSREFSYFSPAPILVVVSYSYSSSKLVVLILLFSWGMIIPWFL